MAKKSKKASSTKSDKGFVFDFTEEVEGGGGGFKVPEGKYLFKIEKFEKGTTSNDNPKLTVHLKGLSGKAKGKTNRETLVLVPSALWKTRHLLEACGVKVPKGKKFKFPLEKLIGKVVCGEVEDGEPNDKGKVYSQVVDFMHKDELEDGPDDEDEEDEEDEEDDDEEDDDEDEDDDEVEDIDLDDEL